MKTAKCEHCHAEVEIAGGLDFGPGTGGDGKPRAALMAHALPDGSPCPGGVARITPEGDLQPARKDGDARVTRFDLGELDPPEKLPNGWVRAQGRISRIGIQEYDDGTGKMRRELRIPEEVFAPESIRSFAQVPLTNTHPPGLLDDKNAKFYTVGSISEPRRVGDWLVADLMIIEAEARRDAEAGRSELSNGYDCDLDPTQIPELVAKYGPYDAIQRNIRGNHCALVDQARAGHDARARLDGKTAVMVASTSAKQGADRMGLIRIDGMQLEATEGNIAAIQQAIDKALAARDAKVSDLTTAVEKAQTKADSAFGLFDRLMGIMKRGKARRDAMKARMMSCDECDGSGQVPDVDADGNETTKTCDYCDGKGAFRMHDKYADLSSAASLLPESKEHGEAGSDPSDDEADEVDALPDGDGDDDDDMDDASELEMERETEETGAQAVGKAKGKKDAADRRKARRDARIEKRRAEIAAARKARRDSVRRRIDRAARSRAALERLAGQVLGEAFKADGKTDLEIRKAVIAKASPEAKLDGKSDAYVRARFDAAVEILVQAPTAADLARAASGGGTGGSTRGRADGAVDPEKARATMLKQYENVHALKGAGK